MKVARRSLGLALAVTRRAAPGGCGGGSASGAPPAPPVAVGFAVAPTMTAAGATVNPIQGVQVVLRDAAGAAVGAAVPVTIALVPGRGAAPPGTTLVAPSAATGNPTFAGPSIRPP